jgi:hypothetical protein
VGTFLVLATWLLGNVDATGTGSAFGGFTADGAHYLVGKEQVCEPLPALAASGTPRCEKVADAKLRKEMGFQKPKRQRKSADGSLKLLAEVVSDRRLVVRGVPEGGGDPIELVAWDAGAEIAVVKGLAPSADGSALAIEYALRAKADAVQVVAFRLPSAPPPPVAPPPAEKPPVPGDAVRRAGGKWTQRLVPCDQAGVDLNLTDKGKFDLVIKTKCREERWTTKLDGTWAPQGGATLILTFQNEGAPEEKLACDLVACDGRECLQCALDDLSFLLTPKK